MAVGLVIHQIYVRIRPMNIDINDDNCPTERMQVPTFRLRQSEPRDMQTMQVELENALYDASCLRKELEIMGRELTDRDAELTEVQAELAAVRDRADGLNHLVDTLSREEAA